MVARLQSEYGIRVGTSRMKLCGASGSINAFAQGGGTDRFMPVEERIEMHFDDRDFRSSSL